MKKQRRALFESDNFPGLNTQNLPNLNDDLHIIGDNKNQLIKLLTEIREELIKHQLRLPIPTIHGLKRLNLEDDATLLKDKVTTIANALGAISAEKYRCRVNI